MSSVGRLRVLASRLSKELLGVQRSLLEVSQVRVDTGWPSVWVPGWATLSSVLGGEASAVGGPGACL